MLNQHREEHSSSCNSEILITKDFLGVLMSCNSQESTHMMDFKAAEAKRVYKEMRNKVAAADNYLQDLNYPPEMKERSLLDLQLGSCEYQSVCTLEKVKNALERDAEKERKRSSSSPSSSSTKTTTKNGVMFAAGCPVCLLYVMTSSTNPKCPRCNSTLSSSSSSSSSSLIFKKPKLDLNASTTF